MAFTKLLVANRGEIAVRVLRTARDLGYPSVAVYSDADAEAPHVAMADEAVRIGPAAAADSYLRVDRILEAAARTGADAIHPGYGFLSENSAFATACAEAGITFVGPPAEAMAAMGDKARAKAVAESAGVPTVPGWRGDAQDDATLRAAALEVGFPLLVKASAGGGGRGMRRVDAADELEAAFAGARKEALGAFGSDHLLLERLVEGARHVEVQVLADTHGHVIHLGERDCSTQRRYQKVLEEAPSPAVDAPLRARMGAAAVALATQIGYVGAGTVEFLLGEGGAFYFLEMNTRLQVEHPVTELVCGDLDLVAMQLAVAAGEALPIAQEDVNIEGHAIEARLYAEDPHAGHLPQTGRILAFEPEESAWIRCDHAIEAGGVISAWYDPMIGKLICWGVDREQARRRLVCALGRTVLLGPQTNKGFLKTLLEHPAFAAGEVTTRFLDTAPATLFARPETTTAHTAVAAALWVEQSGADPWRNSGPWDIPLPLRSGDDELETRIAPIDGGWRVTVGEASHDVSLLWTDGARVRVEVDGLQQTAHAIFGGDALHLELAGLRTVFTEAVARGTGAGATGDGTLKAPMSGAVLTVSVAVGDTVGADDVALTMEAMKIESPLPCGVAGTVEEVRVAAGDRVQGGQILVVVTPE